MTNVFEYKPQLEYILQDIDSIDNISDQEIKIEEPYIRNRASNALELITDNLKKLKDIRSKVDDALRNTAIQIGENTVDETLDDLIGQLVDGDKYLNENIITYSLYKECKNNPILSNIENEWERYHSDMNGLIEAELYPYIDDAEKDNKMIQNIIANTLTYNMETSNMEELKQMELLEIEDFIKNKNELKKAYSSKDINFDRIRSLRKNIDLKDMRLDYNKAMSEIIIDFGKESSNIIATLGNQIDKGNQDKIEGLYREQAAKLNKLINTGNKESKLIIYQGFRDKRERFYSIKEESKSTANRSIRDNSSKLLTTNSRLYLDVAVPIIIDLDNEQIEDDISPAFVHVLAGLEDIVFKKNGMMLDFKNNLKASNRKTKEHLNLISEKDKARRLYRNLK